jgi:hypothetical protein
VARSPVDAKGALRPLISIEGGDMPGEGFFFNPDVISAAIKFLAWTAAAVGTVLALLGTALIKTIVHIWTKTDAKVDRIATCLESLDRTVSTEVATLKGQIATIDTGCVERHKHIDSAIEKLEREGK